VVNQTPTTVVFAHTNSKQSRQSYTQQMSVRLNKNSAHNKTKVTSSQHVQVMKQNKTHARNKTKARYCHKNASKIKSVHKNVHRLKQTRLCLKTHIKHIVSTGHQIKMC